jgi:dTDP-4-amino-4,6-dideoxygalactose transaminase
MYEIRVHQRDLLIAYLKKQGIECGIHYPIPLHLQPAYASLRFRKGQFPVSEQLASEIVSIPIYPELTNEQRQYVVDHIKKFVHQ